VKNERNEKVMITPGQLLLLIGYILYVVYKYVYGKSTIALLPPFYQLCIEVAQYLGAVFIGKKLGPKLTNFIAQQLDILVNPKLKDEEKTRYLESLIRWALIDLNEFYSKEYERFREHLAKNRGYNVFEPKFIEDDKNGKK